MTTNKKLSACAVCFLAMGTAAAPVQAGLVSNLNRGLQIAGFTYFGDDNILTGGREFLATNTFVGNPIDFGPWSLTLQGPLSTGFSVANRPFQSFDFSFGTAPTGSANASPLTYSLNFDLGGQSASFSGSLLIDGGASVDRLGFYTVRLDASSRTTLTGTGENRSEFDFDLGPVNIAGNIYVDVIAFLTAPLFEAANVVNPFDSLTARNQIQAIVDTQTSDLLELLRNGATPGDSTNQRGITLSLVGDRANQHGVRDFFNPGGSNTASAIVPEPTVMLLMLAGLPLACRKASHRRRGH